MNARPASATLGRARGFTLVELMITVLLLAVVVVTLTTVMYSASRSKTTNANNIEASEAGRVAIDMLARDLRSAGYGADRYAATPQQPIAYVDSTQVLINEDLLPYPDTTSARPGSPQAYNPNGTPKPRPLIASDWTPPVKYATGAEMVRWTLDLNDDGVVDANDQSDANGVDAARTPNPDDYELVREVYGDSTNNSAGNNGPEVRRVALVRKPGDSGVPPIFTVYLKGSTTPWDWSSGPVPASHLADIERITVQITAPSGRKDWRGQYAQSQYRTEVNSIRNVPQGSDEYTVYGYVYQDSVVADKHRQVGELGVASAIIRVGLLSTTTGTNGYYSVSVPAGTYWIKQVAPPGWQNTSVPESLSITVPPAGERDFPDQKIAGGNVSVHVFEDQNNNGVQDTGEPGRANVKVTIRPPLATAYTNASGDIVPVMFSNVGACTLSVVAPDSFVTTTTNPLYLTVTNHANLAESFGIYKPQVATLSGKVYRDANRNGVADAGESGIQNVWVGVTTDGGVTVQGWVWSDANGQFSITVPANDPPHNTPYSLMIIPSSGYFPTSSTSINGLYLQAGTTLANQNFGLSSFTVITLQANRVLSLGSADMVEKDWNGNHTENRHGDADIVLGSDTGGSDQVSTWFNQYSSTPLFAASPDYTRSAPGAVMSMALDYVNTDSPLNRPDLVTGCKAAAAGNFFVWFCQNTSGNEGYYPSTYSQAYKTTDQGDVQAVLTADVSGSAAADQPDILVGTKSPTAYVGSFELWTNSNAATPTFSRTETYPAAAGLPAGSVGEVTAMALGDLDGDGKMDLIVGTRTATGGQVYFLKNMGKTASPHFSFQNVVNLTNESVTALALTDVDGDGLLDVVVGTQTSASGGHLIWLRNRTGSYGFDIARYVNAPGIVTALAVADMGGSSRGDLIVGFHTGTSGYVGGARIYYLDAGTIPVNGVDPSSSSLVNWVPAITTNNFNYGTNPAATPPFLPDIAVASKVSATTGAIVVFIR